ncbi:MAG: beta/gamma crystallin domain-containing protein [Pseudomonadota bacterium]
MNRIQASIRKIKLCLAVTVLSLGVGNGAYAQKTDCWVDFYEFPNYKGAHVRLKGPIELRNLHTVQGENWEARIDSLAVGPKAEVHIFENIDFKLTLSEMTKYPDLMRALGISQEEVEQESVLVFYANQKSHHLGEVNFHKKTKSLKIKCGS